MLSQTGDLLTIDDDSEGLNENCLPRKRVLLHARDTKIKQSNNSRFALVSASQLDVALSASMCHLHPFTRRPTLKVLSTKGDMGNLEQVAMKLGWGKLWQTPSRSSLCKKGG